MESVCRCRFIAPTALLLALFLLPWPAAAVSVGTINTFQDGSTQGWDSGFSHPAPPSNVATGGPAGGADKYLLLSALGGAGAGSKLVVFNSGVWSGNYTLAGVTGIAMDVNNIGGSDLSLRLELSGAAGVVFSDTPIQVAAHSGWRHVTFSLAPAALLGPSAALGGVNEVRLYHALTDVGSRSGPAVVAQLGVDNIAAVPEPEQWAMLATGLALLVSASRRRHRRRSH